MNTISNISSLELATFLEKNRITEDEFTQANIEWELLKSIGLNHESLFDVRKESAEFFARVIQGCNKVHSVRWRVKDPEHLMEKIIRKRIPDTKNFNKLYLNIDVENYHEMVTDLVGIRALHLFKDDYIEINNYLMERWIHTSKEKPTYYYRSGDEHGAVPEIFNKKPHPAGYRSIHYIFESQPLNIKLYSEVQVRTIFEEGWSEIDHKVRYPNFSEEQTTKYFLDIFNRLAGSADEMGSFVKALDVELKNRATLLTIANDERQKLKLENEASMASIDRLIDELESSKGKINASSNLIANLKREVERLKFTSYSEKYLTELGVESARIAALATNNKLGLGLGLTQSVLDAAPKLGGSIQHGMLGLTAATTATAAHDIAAQLGLASVDLTKLGGLKVIPNNNDLNANTNNSVAVKKPKEKK
ncbi:RelA/SpoT domain-containing protein [Aeromonas hydrophila]|uniref:RelA/SpoT domain-containing protein n=1 Tax=Aeromonas hydrophila TaxID=644 RepID=UPI0020B1DBBB|nr:hypothetical protein [Aeromonas hydrophila]MCP3323011.1 hypothetical protein [Aeromonas hydrophila]